MPEITLTDLLAWEPRLRPPGHAGLRSDPADAEEWEGRELGWAVTARASAPMLPAIRGGELVLLPNRVLADAGVALPVLLRELASHGISAVVLDAPLMQPSPVPILLADAIAPDFEGELNRMLTERRGELYRSGTDLGRMLTVATSAGADLPLVLGTAASFLAVSAAVTDVRGATVAATSPDALPAGGPRSIAALDGLNRVWRDGRFMVRLANGEALWLGPVPRPRRALARLASERIALAAEAAIQRSADARPRGPARATALTALLLGTEADAPRAAAALGLAASGVYRVALASPEMEQATLQRTMATFGAAHEAAAIDRAHAALIEVRPESVATGGAGGRSTTVRRRDAAGRDGSPAMSGWLALSSPVVGVAGLPAAAREARFTAALVVSGSAAGPVAKFDSLNDLGPHQLLYRLWGTPDLARFAADALGELPARDRRGTLRHTLLTYLQTGGSHVDAAARLGIHRNTLSYRLKQIAALTGREPTDPATQLVSHLALLASSLPPAP